MITNSPVKLVSLIMQKKPYLVWVGLGFVMSDTKIIKIAIQTFGRREIEWHSTQKNRTRTEVEYPSTSNTFDSFLVNKLQKIFKKILTLRVWGWNIKPTYWVQQIGSEPCKLILNDLSPHWNGLNEHCDSRSNA